MPKGTCSVEGCEEIAGVPGTAKGLCSKHYNRLRRNGDVTAVRGRAPIAGPEHHLWKGADVGYKALHRRVYRARGKASRCEQCGVSEAGRRYEWAMIHGTDGTDPHAHYISLCRGCHRTYDLGRLSHAQRAEIRVRVGAGESQRSLAREFGISASVISRGLSGRSAKWGTG